MKIIKLNTNSLETITQCLCSVHIAINIPSGYYCKTPKEYAIKLYNKGNVNMRVFKK